MILQKYIKEYGAGFEIEQLAVDKLKNSIQTLNMWQSAILN